MGLRFTGFYIGVVLLAVVLATKPSDAPSWTFRGLTEQGEVVRLRLDDRGRVQRFEVEVDLECELGGHAAVLWTTPGAPTRFASRGPRLSATTQGHFHGALSGTVHARQADGRVELTTDRGARGVCRSGPVHWSAG